MTHLYAKARGHSMARMKYIILMTLLALSGCTYYYTPDPDEITLDVIVEFESSALVSLVNSQQSTDKLVYYESMGGGFYTDLRSTTETVIAILERELSQRGMTVNPTNRKTKTLELSVTKVEATPDWYDIPAGVVIHVETLSGYSNDYVGTFRGSNLYKGFNGALMMAVTQILNDPNIIKYLESPDSVFDI
jgi:hypothetical protein